MSLLSNKTRVLGAASTTRVVSAKPINDENVGIGNGAKRVATRSAAPLQNITNLSKDQTKKPVLKVQWWFIFKSSAKINSKINY